MSSKNRGKYISVGRLLYRSDLDGDKVKPREYLPGSVVDEDLSDAEVERYLRKGVLREAAQAKQEQKAREVAAQVAQQSEDAEAKAAADAEAAAAVAQAEEAAAKAKSPGKKK